MLLDSACNVPGRRWAFGFRHRAVLCVVARRTGVLTHVSQVSKQFAMQPLITAI